MFDWVGKRLEGRARPRRTLHLERFIDCDGGLVDGLRKPIVEARW